MVTLDLAAIEERAKRNLVADYDCEGGARDVLALVEKVRRLEEVESAAKMVMQSVLRWWPLNQKVEAERKLILSLGGPDIALSREPGGEGT